MDWQPIETAPKDGTLILVSVKNGITIAGGGKCGTRWWNKTVPAAWQRGHEIDQATGERIGGSWYAYSPSWWGEIRKEINGWMPMPEPPKIEPAWVEG